jgi:hypothetical protein
VKKFVFFFAILGIQVIYAQDFTQFWLRATLLYAINPKLSSSIELHHRTESLHNTESPFRYPLTNACRLWIVYKLSDHETINFSPYAFFSNQPPIRKDSDVLNSNANEHRIHLQYENKLPVGKAWSLISRFGAEYRFFEKNRDLFRMRIREGLSYSLTKKISIQIYDELFLNTMNVDEKHIFDQNRIGIVSSFSLSNKFKLELGATHIQSAPRNSSVVMNNIMFQTNWNYSL